MLEKLSQGLRGTLDKLMKSVFVDKSLIEEIVRDIQRALLQGDVDVNLVFELSERIKSRALKEEVPGLTKKEVIMKIVYEELVRFLGEKEARINITKTPFFIMLVGLYASGKTTTAAKLANYFKKRGFKVALIQTDTYRPAAYEQLLQLGSQINVDIFGNKNKKNPYKIFEEFKTKLKSYDVVIVDTAGRDALSEELVLEMKNLKQRIMPDEVLLVLSADIGQAAKKQAEAFHENCGITGVIITKLEGTAKGGGAITACKATGASVKFIGVGEKIQDLEVFEPEGFVSRLLGFGDLKSLLEKVREAVPEEKAEDLAKKFVEGKFTLKDLYDQMIAMKKMGPLSKIVDLIPGFSSFKLPKELIDVQQEKLEKWKYAMDSMTKEELENPDILNISRINRISKGSGVSVADIRLLLKQYRQSKKLAKMLKSQVRGNKIPKNLQGLMKNFKNVNF
ncbi:MAG: signal recognition particle protein Srp54 [Candidatus Woesearchaeota archaeon]